MDLKSLIKSACYSVVVSGGLAWADETTLSPPYSEDSGTGLGGGPHGGRSVWDIHKPLFIGILIFLGVAFLVTILCFICLKVCRKKRVKQPEKIITDEPERLTPYSVTHAQKAMVESVPTGDPLPADEENGWIIPLDQMTPEELDQPEVPFSKV